MHTHPALAVLVDAVDRPTRSALTLGQRGLPITAAQAGLGLAAVAAATLSCQLLLGRGELATTIDGLAAFLETAALLLPLLLVAGFLQVRVPLRGLLGALAVSSVHAGLVALCLVPLAVFVALVADMAAVHERFSLLHAAMVGLVVPAAALQTLLGRLAQTIRSLDRRRATRLLCGLVQRVLLLVFLARALRLLF
jgi:hypothetical protein